MSDQPALQQNPRAPHTVSTRAELQEWLGITDSQMWSVERALAVRQTKSSIKSAKTVMAPTCMS